MPDAHRQPWPEPHFHNRRDADRMRGIFELMHHALFAQADDDRVRHPFADNGGDARRITLELMGAVSDHVMIAVLNRHLRLQRLAEGIRQRFHTVKKTIK
ncbi:hypothetical protein D3C85_1491650 [compost metagenome]